MSPTWQKTMREGSEAAAAPRMFRIMADWVFDVKTTQG
jgi:hypothetical protein